MRSHATSSMLAVVADTRSSTEARSTGAGSRLTKGKTDPSGEEERPATASDRQETGGEAEERRGQGL